MLFDTGTSKVGSNAHVTPIRRNAILPPNVPVHQEIVGARTYEFREVYDSNEQSQADLERVVNIAHDHFSKQPASSQSRSAEAESVNIQWSGWEIRRNEVVCGHRFESRDGSVREFQIHCTLDRGIMGHAHTFINFLAKPPPIQVEPDLIAALRTQDGSIQTGQFPVMATQAHDGSLVINVPSREGIGECLKVFRTGRDFALQIGTPSGMLAQIPLQNNDSFRTCFDRCQQQVSAR